MQNGHFYFCTPDIVGIRFLKSGHFAWDILTIFQNTLHAMLFCKKLSIFSFDHPSHAKLQFLFENNDFFTSPKIKEVADRRQGSSFLSFFCIFHMKCRSL